ncbi:hypothetical protein ACLQ9H_16640, partial [Bordetella avium]
PELQRRLIRVSKAPAYLDMSRKVFNKDVRPWLREIQIGIQGKAFDLRELDAWVDKQLAATDSAQNNDDDTTANKYSRTKQKQGDKIWREKPSRAFNSVAGSGTLTSKSKGMDAFAKALAQATGKKPKSS